MVFSGNHLVPFVHGRAYRLAGKRRRCGASHRAARTQVHQGEDDMGESPEEKTPENGQQAGDSRRTFITRAAALSGAAIAGPAFGAAQASAKPRNYRKNRAEGHSGIHTDTD